MTWTEFWQMGGYALYVWGSYAVTAGLLVAEVALLKLRRRNALAGAAEAGSAR